MKHRAPKAFALPGREFFLGSLFGFSAWSRPLGREARKEGVSLGRETSGKDGVYGALLSGTWVGWRGDHFRGRGELKGDIQLCSTTRERLKAQTCWAALLPKVDHMGELVLGESMGSGGPGSWRGHCW